MYGRRTFHMRWEEGSEMGRGSGRSVAGFDLHAALHRVGHHLAKYGGHTMAAGLTIRRERYDAFRVAFLAVAGELLGDRKSTRLNSTHGSSSYAVLWSQKRLTAR